LGSIFSIASAEIKSTSSFGLLFQILPGKSFVMAHIFLVLVNPFSNTLSPSDFLRSPITIDGEIGLKLRINQADSFLLFFGTE